MLELAIKVANFVWDFDPYEAKDRCDSFPNAVEETFDALTKAKEDVIEYLKSIIEEDYEVEYAKELLKEVNAL